MAPASRLGGQSGGPPPMPPPLRGQRSRTRLGRSFHLSANEWLEPAKQQEGGSSSTVRRVGGARERVRRPLSRPPGHTVPTAQECGARPPESRPGASFSWRSNGGQSPRRAAASRRPLLSREPRGSVAVLAGAGGGTEGEGLLPSVVFKFPGRGWNALQASLPRPGARGGGALLLGRPPLPTWQRPTRSAGRITPGSRKSRVAVGVDTGNRTSLSQHSSTSSDGKNDSTESRNNVPCVIPNTTQPRIRGEFASHAATPSSVVRAF